MVKVELSAEVRPPQFVLEEVRRRVFDDPGYLLEPAMREASAQLVAFHEREGNGRWRRLKRSTLARRERAGQRSGTPIGVQTGRLRASIRYGHPDYKVVKLNDQVWYSYPNVRVQYRAKGGAVRDAGLAFLFGASRRLWPPTKGRMEDAVNEIAQAMFARRVQEVMNGA